MPSIHVEQLTKNFGSLSAVSGLTLTVEDGQLICLLGPSGCGKTTTLRCIAGLETPTQGRIRIGDRTVNDTDRKVSLPPGKRNIGMVFQSYAIWPHLSVGDNVGYPLRRRHIDRQQRIAMVGDALDSVGLSGFADRRSTELSGGQQQRVALARAMVASPDILLFDEPLSNLDARLRQTLREEIKRTHELLGTASLYVTHDQTEALALADRVVVMSEGAVVQNGTPTDVFERPANRFVADFVGVDNILPGRCIRSAGGDSDVDVPGLGRLGVTVTDRAVRDGDAVDLAIRASDLVVGGVFPIGCNRIAGTIREVSFLGEYLEVCLESGAGRVVARCQRNAVDADSLQAGSAAELRIDREQILAMKATNPPAIGEDDANTQDGALATSDSAAGGRMR